MRKDITLEKIMRGGEKMNKSALARQYECCWRTIDRRLNPNKYKTYLKKRIYTSKLDEYKTIIDEKGNQVQTYVDAKQAITLQQLSDYIISREPIVTAFGTMFKHHGEVPNPLVEVVFQFLSNRSEYKNLMFTFPKGSEDFEKYNLLQLLSKIDANG